MESVLIFEGKNLHEALMVKELLETNDFICNMPNNHISGVMPQLTLISDSFSVYVENSDFHEAAELLLSLNYDISNRQLLTEFVNENFKDSELTLCPKCGVKSLQLRDIKKRGIIAIIYLLFRTQVPTEKVIGECKICGFKKTYSK